MSAASTTVEGVGTRFLTELRVGDVISLSTDPTVYATIVSIESDTSLTVNIAIGDGTAASITVRRTEPITLVHLARQPNGRTAQIIGTPTTLYRYQASDDVAYARDDSDQNYAEADYFAEDYTVEDTASAYFAEDYTETSPGAWIIIGRNFNPNGSRWEAVSINGWSVFNNGKDLLVSYRVEDEEVEPIYELREQGIAYVGTIAEYNGILLIGDVAEIKEGTFATLFDHESSGAITASQTGSIFSDSITGSRVGVTNQVVASSAIFTAGMVGYRVVFADGFSSTIVTVDDSTHVTLAAAPVGVSGLLFYIINDDADYLVTASSAIFSSTDRGRELFFMNGVSRRITSVLSSTQVEVNNHRPIASQTFMLENVTAYDAFTNEGQLNRIQYRMAWGMPGLPRRWGAVLSGSTVSGSRYLDLDYPVRSLEIGMDLTIVGAGLNGANHTSEILFIGANLTTITLREAPEASVSAALIQASDSIDSIVGYEDLQDDSSAIIRMLPLKNALVIYKDTSIFMCRYTALPEAPFDFGQQGPVYRGSQIPYYRNTLLTVNDEVHLYAGRDHFYVFDISTRTPREHQPALAVANLFYDHATLARTNEIWAADNQITQEIFVGLPIDLENEDQILCFDYHYNTASTSSMRITAGGLVKRPVPGRAVGVVEDWFVMGESSGTVLLYGRCNEPQEQWNDAPAIWHRAGGGYESILKSGLWGSGFSETDLIAYMPELSSFESPTQAQVELTLFGWKNSAKPPPEELAVVLLEAPADFNCPEMFFRHFYFQDQLRIEGANNSCRLAARTIEASPVGSRSFGRVPAIAEAVA